MEKQKLDWIISIIKEQMGGGASPTMSTGSTAGAPGFSGAASPKGPTAGFDPVMGFRKRKGPQIKLPPGSRNRWKPKKPTP
jgi:hypothetical protein